MDNKFKYSNDYFVSIFSKTVSIFHKKKLYKNKRKNIKLNLYLDTNRNSYFEHCLTKFTKLTNH